MDAAPETIDGLEVARFETADALEKWLVRNGSSHPGMWIRLSKAGSGVPSVTFDEVLELGIAHGWSESTRRSFDRDSYLQRFTPRRTRRTTSARNLRIADRLESEGRMTDAGRAALGRRPS